MRKTTVFAAAALFTLAVTAAAAGPWGPGMGPRAALLLELTPDQSAELQALDEAHWKEVAPLRNELLAKREELRQLMAVSESDRAAVLAKQREIHEVQGRIRELGVQHQLDRRALLTPEQQQKLADLGGPGYRGGRGRDGPRW